MHAAATCAAARRMAMRPVQAPFDVVVTTNSRLPAGPEPLPVGQGNVGRLPGRPARAGRSSARPSAATASPDHGSYRELLASAPYPQELFDGISARAQTVPDQWQVQIQARIQSGSRVIMHTSHLSDAELAAAHLEQTHDVTAAVAAAMAAAGPGGRLCVLPEGPQTIPYVREETV